MKRLAKRLTAAVLLAAVFALMDVPIMLKKRKEDKLLSAVK